jgi:hypothetical protein
MTTKIVDSLLKVLSCSDKKMAISLIQVAPLKTLGYVL